MVILLGGSSHVGKTLVAQKLMERFGFPYMSFDHLKMGFIRSGMTSLTVNDDWEMRYWMWPFVSSIAKTAVENGQNLILEGCYIPHNWKETFSSVSSTSPESQISPKSPASSGKTDSVADGDRRLDYMADIRSVFIVMSRRYIEGNFDLIRDYADVIEHRLDDSGLDMQRLVMCSEGFKQDCIGNGTPYVEIDEAFDIDELVERVASALGLDG